MSLAIWYWLFYVIGLLFSGFVTYRGDPAGRPWGWGNSLLLAILLFIIGMKLFGSPVSG